jgi:DNA helicase-2/ATP-dependent DNA helicase PcrA
MRQNYKEELNPPQYEAVTSIDGPLSIIAGAGSGKTRVITYRIAYMLERGIPQHAILALTFTNKAAREMETRVKEITGKKLQSLTVSTFHAFGVKILRDDCEALGWRKNFSIYDETDRAELIKECLREARLNTDKTNLFEVGQLFSDVKTSRASNAGAYSDIYAEYNRSLKIFNAFDFDDLITVPIRLFEEHPAILAKYRARYKYILVDEFQDTSLIQYTLMRLLALGVSAQKGAEAQSGFSNVCVVGDDDQSIYSWRGANYENLLLFEKDFPGRKEIKLEQNYRSTTTILEAANGVISHNANRKEKKLWSGISGGKPVELYHPENETEEGEFIAARISEHKFRDDRRKYEDFGILLRTNSMTRAIEEALLERNIPYRVSGGQSFFQRKEIKDILSYMRVIANERDDVNLLRIINTPRRGIGKNSVAAASDIAAKNRMPLWDALERICQAGNLSSGSLSAENSPVPPKVRVEMESFIGLMAKHREAMRGGGTLSEKVRALVDEINYWPYLVAEYGKKDDDKIARWKMKNIEYFINSIEVWEKNPDTEDAGLYAWLNRVSLITRDDDGDEKGKANVMTIHAAKGLEFPVVFIAGAEDGIIPHTRSIEDEEERTGGDGAAAMEEERRLFYVAITRAREKLYITSCKKRRRLNEIADCAPSPFLEEIPVHLIETREAGAAAEESAQEDDDAFFAKMKALYK